MPRCASAQSAGTKPQARSERTGRSTMALPKTALGSRILSDKSLTRKASLNALASALDYAARLGVGFIINPVLVAGLGDYWYGAWQVLGRLLGYISPASGRPGEALKWSIAHHQASTDYEEKRRYVGSAVVVSILFLPLLATLGGLLAWFSPSLLKAPAEFARSIRLAAGLLVLNQIVTSLTEVGPAVLRGENLGYKRMGLSTVLTLVGGGLMALAVYLGTGIVGVATAYLAATVLTGALLLQIARTYVPWFGIARPSRGAVRRFLGLSWWFLGWNLIMTLMMGGDVVVLGLLESLALVTTYTLTKYAPETIINLVAMMLFGSTPGLGGIVGSGDLERTARLRNEIMAFTWLVVTAAASTVLLWNHAFLRLWVGEKYYAGPIANLLIIVVVSQFVLIRNDSNIIDLTLNLRHKVLLGALSIALWLGAAGLLVGYFKLGIVGMSLSLIVGRSILSLAYPLLVGRFLGISLFSQFKGVLRPAFVTVLLVGLTAYLGLFSTASTWFALVLSVGSTLVVLSLLSFFVGLSTHQRRSIWKRIRLVIGPVVSG
jgi:O-antigen/teichoic acid export membrane protein